MAMLTVRNLHDEVYRALRVRAGVHGRKVKLADEEVLEFDQRPRQRRLPSQRACSNND